jgi:hypothetical protein
LSQSGSSGGAHRQCSHRGSQWKCMRCGKEDGRCRRSPGTWEGTARRSGRT